MKKILMLTAGSLMLFFSSCSVDPNSDKLSDDFVVYTDYDKEHVDFTDFSTFYVPDSVLIIGDKKEMSFLDSKDGDPIIEAVVTNLVNKGYTQTDNKDEATFGMQVSYVENTNTLLGYINGPGSGWNWGWNWWGGYPYYWGPSYWGPGWGGPYFYYPYPVAYSYSVGSYLVEFVDLSHKAEDANAAKENKLPVRWTAYMSGLLYNSSNANTKLAVNAINQAFTQSPYLTNK